MLNKQQHKEFKDYCQLNEIEDIDWRVDKSKTLAFSILL